MRIAVIGAGAMGMLFGGYLSRAHDVRLLDLNETRVDAVNREGIIIREADGAVEQYRPAASLSGTWDGPADLVILFVKSLYSETALSMNHALLENTGHVLTLQNGAGHEAILEKHVPRDKILIGTTQHNSLLVSDVEIRHGGAGVTCIGAPWATGRNIGFVANAFRACGLETEITADAQRAVWQKLLLNATASALTAVLQVPLGFLVENGDAWVLMGKLVHEAVAVANAAGMGFDAEAVLSDIRGVMERAKGGYTSIYADVRDGRRTEVDMITGTVVRAGAQHGVPTPQLSAMVSLIHALEAKNANP